MAVTYNEAFLFTARKAVRQWVVGGGQLSLSPLLPRAAPTSAFHDESLITGYHGF